MCKSTVLSTERATSCYQLYNEWRLLFCFLFCFWCLNTSERIIYNFEFRVDYDTISPSDWISLLECSLIRNMVMWWLNFTNKPFVLTVIKLLHMLTDTTMPHCWCTVPLCEGHWGTVLEAASCLCAVSWRRVVHMQCRACRECPHFMAERVGRQAAEVRDTTGRWKQMGWTRNACLSLG